jgi:hydroxymethylpyrimidine pyrophosphatase-like HAD family hydrolase
MKTILAVDFDGTIIKDEKDYVPRKLLSNAKEVLKWAHDKGCFIIIWTCRSGKMLKQATDFLKKNEIQFDAVNENSPLTKFETSRKIFADFYIDDRSFDINWLDIKKRIQKILIEKTADKIQEQEK